MSVSGGGVIVPPLSAPVVPASQRPVQPGAIQVSSGTSLELSTGSSASTAPVAVGKSAIRTGGKRRLPSSSRSELDQQLDRKLRVESAPSDRAERVPDGLILRVTKDPHLREFLTLPPGDPSRKLDLSDRKDAQHFQALTPELFGKMASTKKGQGIPCWIGTRFGVALTGRVEGKKSETVEVMFVRAGRSGSALFPKGPWRSLDDFGFCEQLVNLREHSVLCEESARVESWMNAICWNMTSGTGTSAGRARHVPPEVPTEILKLDSASVVTDPDRIKPQGTLVLVDGRPAVSTGESFVDDKKGVRVELRVLRVAGISVKWDAHLPGTHLPGDWRVPTYFEATPGADRFSYHLPTDEQTKLVRKYTSLALTLPIPVVSERPIKERIVSAVSPEAGFMTFDWDGKSPNAVLRSQQQIEELDAYHVQRLRPQIGGTWQAFPYEYHVPPKDIPPHLRVAIDSFDGPSVPFIAWRVRLHGSVALDRDRSQERENFPLNVARDCKFAAGEPALNRLVQLARPGVRMPTRLGFSLRDAPGEPDLYMFGGVVDGVFLLLAGATDSAIAQRHDFKSLRDEKAGITWKKVPVAYVDLHRLEDMQLPSLPPLPRRPVPASVGTARHPCAGETSIGKVGKDVMATSVLRPGDLVSFGKFTDIPVSHTVCNEDLVWTVALLTDSYTRDALMDTPERTEIHEPEGFFKLESIKSTAFPLSFLVEAGLTSSAKTLNADAIRKRTSTQQPFYVSVVDEEPPLLCLPHTADERQNVSLIVIEPTLYMDHLLKSAGASPPKFMENSDALVYEYVDLTSLSLRYEADGPALRLPVTSDHLSLATRKIAMKHFALDALTAFVSDTSKDEKSQSTRPPTLALPNLAISKSPKAFTRERLEIDQATGTCLVAAGLVTLDSSGVHLPTSRLHRLISEDMQAAQKEGGIKERADVLRHVEQPSSSEVPKAVTVYLSSVAERVAEERGATLMLHDIARLYRLVPIEAEPSRGSVPS